MTFSVLHKIKALDNHGFPYFWSDAMLLVFCIHCKHPCYMHLSENLPHRRHARRTLRPAVWPAISKISPNKSKNIGENKFKKQGSNIPTNSKNISQPQSLPSLKFAINYREPTYLFCSNKRHKKQQKINFLQKNAIFLYFLQHIPIDLQLDLWYNGNVRE